jgi:hypothetical protein
MNFIVSTSRASFITKTISSLLLPKIVVPPLTHFDPAKYVDSQLLQNCHSAIDTNNKERSQDIVADEKLIKIQKFL